MKQARPWAVYHHSHWQGSGPDTLVASGTQEACMRFEHELDTCSFCSPGRTANYSVGTCYVVRQPKYLPRDARELPLDAAGWEASDFAAWLGDDE